MKLMLKFFALNLLITGITLANIINVPGDQPTIQAGLMAATEGDIVQVSAGTYTENLTWPATNGIKLIGEDRETTIIDGNQQARVIRFAGSNIDTTTLITGFTITNGSASSGGGISCRENSSPSLENVTISNNSATGDFGGYGGGIYCYYNSSPSLANVTLSNNSANISGGGIYCDWNSSPSLANVTITNNSADSYGGGIWCYGSSPSLENVTISDNTAGMLGGGIYCNWNSSPSLANVTITNNSADSYGGGIYCYYNSSPSLVNCILWNDAPQEVYLIAGSVNIFYSDIQGGEAGIVTNDNGTVYWEEGNIDLDPLFDDSLYHLSINSPCIDAGNPSTEYNDACLPPGLGDVRNDMGAFGGPGNCGWLDSGNTPPEVTNVIFQQDVEGEQTVTITYDLNDEDEDEMTIIAFVSFDGGNEWTECGGVDGDVGAGINSGMNKQITWDFGTQFPNTFSNQVLIKVEADDGI